MREAMGNNCNALTADDRAYLAALTAWRDTQ